MQIPEGYQRGDDCACGLNNWRNDLISDSIFGLSIKEACCIHDWMYERGATSEDRARADQLFLENVLYLISTGRGSRAVRWARKTVAFHYYEGLRIFGGLIFWSGKGGLAHD